MKLHQLKTEFRTSDLETLVSRWRRFFEANGYVIEELEDPTQRRCSRGEPGAGWSASNMTQLHAQVHLKLPLKGAEQGVVVMTHDVEIVGQKLSDEDKKFWQREVKAATMYIQKPQGEPQNLRVEEEQRALKIRKHFYKQALRWALISFILVSLVGVLLVRFGFLEVS